MVKSYSDNQDINIDAISVPQHVNYIIETLERSGFEAYAVGGCVRDSIMGHNPNDWDITTSALPQQVKKLFLKTIDTGLKHGTVTILIKNKSYEITTYRIDGEYEGNRKPKTVAFTSDLVEDLKRRDFTINAMAYNEKSGLVDAFSGIKDLEDGIIRCVGDANQRFNEDALRMLRAIRFSARFGFDIAEETKKAIQKNAHLIKNVSAERIHVELTKTLLTAQSHYMHLLVDLGLMEHIIPEFLANIGIDQKNHYHIFTVDEHIYKALSEIEATEMLRWTMFLHDIGKGIKRTIDENGMGHFHGHVEESVKIAKAILNRLKFDNKTKADILKLIQLHDYRFEPTMKAVRRATHIIGDDLFLDFIQVQKADIKAQNPVYKEERLKKLDKIVECYKRQKELNQCTTLKDLNIKGYDLIKIGISEGKDIGKILNQLLEIVIDEPKYNNKEYLIKRALDIKK